jgi:1-deoxy-D-xylulose-5-phosphate reductoisomerase
VKKVAILGSTGTIGRLTLDVIESLEGKFRVFAIAANRNTELLSSQISRFEPEEAVVFDEEQCALLHPPSGTNVSCGPDNLARLAANPDVDVVVVAMTGTAAVDAVITALKLGKRVALASKEILVSYGKFVNDALARGGGELLPVDSEHNALHQCLDDRDKGTVKKMILTASGGPFRTREYQGATVKDVLNHPTWNMGKRITVDSATLMNKGFEVIEAHYLFGIKPEKIDILIHPQSIVHSMVEFKDGSVLAQLSIPDMRLPIEYALCYPERGPGIVPELDLRKIGSLDFSEPDFERFPCLELAFRSLKLGGTAPAALEAADHEAVKKFLDGSLDFHKIPIIIDSALRNHKYIADPSMDEIRTAQRLAREFINEGV